MIVVSNYLTKIFIEREIMNYGPVKRIVGSLDLNVLYTFLWGILKKKINL